MTSRGNGQQETYRVTHAGPVKQTLATEYRRAKLNGEGKAFIAALEHVYNRLRLNPQSFGDGHSAIRLIISIIFCKS